MCNLVQYLGCVGVGKTHGAGSTDDAVKQIIHHVSDISPNSMCNYH